MKSVFKILSVISFFCICPLHSLGQNIKVESGIIPDSSPSLYYAKITDLNIATSSFSSIIETYYDTHTPAFFEWRIGRVFNDSNILTKVLGALIEKCRNENKEEANLQIELSNGIVLKSIYPVSIYSERGFTLNILVHLGGLNNSNNQIPNTEDYFLRRQKYIAQQLRTYDIKKISIDGQVISVGNSNTKECFDALLNTIGKLTYDDDFRDK